MTLPRETLDEIKRLHAEATPGPWEWDDDHRDANDKPLPGREHETVNHVSTYEHGHITEFCEPKNGRLIAFVRNNLPALIEAAERTEKLEAALLRALECLDDENTEGEDYTQWEDALGDKWPYKNTEEVKF